MSAQHVLTYSETATTIRLTLAFGGIEVAWRVDAVRPEPARFMACMTGEPRWQRWSIERTKALRSCWVFETAEPAGESLGQKEERVGGGLCYQGDAVGRDGTRGVGDGGAVRWRCSESSSPVA